MKNFCIKTNNKDAINFINNKLNKIKFDGVRISNRSFALYENIIVHYSEDLEKKLISAIAKIITECIIVLYEKTLVCSLIDKNYFYFSEDEKEDIYEHYLENSNEDDFRKNKKQLIKSAVLKYLTETQKIFLDGFILFRLKNPITLLDEMVDLSVNSFLLEKEYVEFIYLLRLYIETKFPCLDLVHFIYHNNNSLLVDEYLNVIPINKDISNIKYLSDISFCNNDYLLSTLLQISPRKLIIHYSGSSDNDFLNALKLIFEDRVEICDKCSICSIFVENNIL